MKFYTSLLLVANIVNILCKCPTPETLNPCKCNVGIIQCGGHEKYNLKHIFAAINQELGQNEKHFMQLHLNNTAITELEENLFSEITFDEILIDNASNLKHISSDAFTATNLVTKIFHVIQTPIENFPPSHDLFHSLSLMLNIETIVLDQTAIKQIPNNAFRSLNGVQNKLKTLLIRYGVLKTIGNHAFGQLNNLTVLALNDNQIDLIESNALSFGKFSNESIIIYLDKNSLNGSSFEFGSLSSIGRPATIELDWKNGDHKNNPIKFVDQQIFLPFFELNSGNHLKFGDIELDCDDCRNYWLKSEFEGRFYNRIDFLTCSNGKSFSNNTNFENCD